MGLSSFCVSYKKKIRGGEPKKLDKKPNYMTIPMALKELEKIEMVRQSLTHRNYNKLYIC